VLFFWHAHIGRRLYEEKRKEETVLANAREFDAREFVFVFV
jgi:hypothetical protein